MNLAVKEGNRFPCVICGAQIARKSDLRVHLENMHGASNRIHYCDLCGAVCKNKAALRIHIYRWHKQHKEPRGKKAKKDEFAT
jgi:ferredoxin